MGEPDSPRGSTKSSQQGNKVHWLLHGRDAVEKVGGRFVAEEDLKSEREYWVGTCMQEVRGLETATLEKLRLLENSVLARIEEQAVRLEREVTSRLLQQCEAERTERVAAITEMRRDLGVQRDLQNQVARLQKELSGLSTAFASVSGSPQQPAAARPSGHQQEGATEAAIADLRSEFSGECERQELQAETTKMMLSALRHDLSTQQVSQIQALQEQALRSSSDLSHSIQGVTTAFTSSQASLKADLMQEINSIRKDLDKERSSADAQLGQLKRLEDQSRFLSDRVNEVDRLLTAVKQDTLSETTLLKGRMEAVAGAQDDHLSEVASLRRLLSEAQGGHVTSARLEGLEQRLSSALAAASTASTSMPQKTEVDGVAVVLARVELLEKELPALAKIAPTAARLEEMENQLSLFAKASVVAPRLEHLERQLPALSSAFEAAKENAALIARLETVEALCLGSKSGGAAPLRDGSDTGTLKRSLAELQGAMDSTRGNVERLARDLVEERSERYRALAEVGRLTEDVAKAAAATIEKAEKRFSEGLMIGPGIDGDLGTPGKGGHSPDAVSTVSAGTHTTDPLDRALRRPSDDVELRGALAVHVRSLTAELRGEIMGEVAVRVATADARVGALEARLGGDLQRSNAELNARISVLESAHLPSRTASLEEQAKKTSVLLVNVLEEHSSRKAASSAIEAIEQDVRRALTEGVRDEVTESTSASVSVPGTAPGLGPGQQRARSTTPSERSITSTRSHAAVGVPESRAGAGAGAVAVAPSSAVTSAVLPGAGARSPVGSAVALGHSHSYGHGGSASLPPGQSQADHSVEAPQAESPEDSSGLTHGLKESLEGLVSAVHRTLHQQRASPSRPRTSESKERERSLQQGPAGPQGSQVLTAASVDAAGRGRPSLEPLPRGSPLVRPEASRPLAQRDLESSGGLAQSLHGRGNPEGPSVPRPSLPSFASGTHPEEVDMASQSWPNVSTAPTFTGSNSKSGAVRPQSPTGSARAGGKAAAPCGVPGQGATWARPLHPQPSPATSPAESHAATRLSQMRPLQPSMRFAGARPINS